MSSNVQLRLQVPFEQKDAAKALGARWLPSEKTWYVPHGADIELFKRWWPASLLLDQAASPKSFRSQSVGGKTASASMQPNRIHSPGDAKRLITGPENLVIEDGSKLPWEE